MNKGEILREFSSDPDRYYKVALFEERGFVRKSCSECGRFFWTLDASRDACPDDAQDTYSFIGDPPTSKRFDYTQAWKQVEEFFVRNGHTSVGRYPTVCRWRDDLYFTIASIVDFQRIMGSKVVFEFPANPLVVPQTCLRFKDLENVGVTGRHFSSFCMIGQHSIADSEGYWKDRCVELDYELVTKQFGIRQEEIVFVEDVWAGGGSFGPSLEYFVRGLELGNAVFTEFQGELGRHTTLDQRIIDMGAGLERFAWVTKGTPTAYDCCFGPVNEMLLEKMGIDTDSEALRRYFTEVARGLERHDLNEVRRRAKKAAGISDEQQDRMIAPLEGAYLVADHLRTLIFAITDGALPSNVGGGYNLRMMLRRIIGTTSRLGVKIDIDELVDAHIDYLRDTYPELDSKRDDVKEILGIEESRYGESREHMRKKSQKIQNPTVDELLTLYESDGITPEYLREVGAIQEIPSTFYARLSELHQSDRKKEASDLPLDGVPETEPLFYGDDPAEFDARVLRVFGDCVVLDRTSFYARGGGQEPDHGTIAGCDVTDVEKHAGIIVHRLRGAAPKEGDTVSCVVDAARRDGITKNHTSTHILNASSRKVLGSWVWQHSAFKDYDHARLDITHHSSLTASQVSQIEDAANKMVSDNIPVTIQYFERGAAEQKYGFSIYQGGVVPVKSVRIVSIQDADVEACGGTHVKSTGDIGLIKITRTKRIQDGIVRLEFVSGAAASEHVKSRQAESQRHEEIARQKESLQKERDESREKTRGMIPGLLERAASGTIGGVEGIESADRACLVSGDGYDEFFHASFGKKLVSRDPGAAYCGIFESGMTVRIIVYCGIESGMDAGSIARSIAGVLGGSSGGSKEFAQGGGKDTSKKAGAVDAARSMILGRHTA
ncbi:MAG: alanine--tRNA ligase [Nitrosopumilus sp. H13]|nr:MAG: alanine--tRNA ligase [Nitrosopumilus sp. H13]